MLELQNHTYTYENISQDPELFNSETGLNKEAFEKLFTLLNANEGCTSITLIDSKLKFSEL